MGIESQPTFGMLVIHTSQAELYERLWCVYEVNEAAEHNVPQVAALSMAYLMGYKDIETEDNLRVHTKNAKCWSPDDAKMITKHVTEAGGFEVLDQKILKFRSSSFHAAKTMFEEFVVWFKAFQEGTKKEGLEFIVNAIQNAALFIGLHCLKFFAEDAGDDETCETILANGKDIVGFFMEGDFVFSEVPPPRFDPRKIVDFMDCDDESLMCAIDCISEDGDFGGMMMEFLRMSGGGRNEMSCESAKRELSEQEKM